jgi:hypothetical protein
MHSRFLCLSTLVLLTTSCDQLSATMQTVSVLTKTPNLANAHGMDTALASVLPFTAMKMPEATLAVVGVAQKESATSTAAPTPVTGAQVFVAWQTQEVKVCEKTDAAGTYAATSVPLDTCASAALTYVENERYVTRIETGTDVYTVNTIPPAPVNVAAVTFSPQMGSSSIVTGAALTVPHHVRGTDLKVDWSADPAAAKRHAFAVLGRLNYVGSASDVAAPLQAASWQADSANPVFDNTPKKPEEMIRLIINEAVPNVTIPGQQALNTKGLYILVITTTELSTEVSSNLALGSGGLAGAGVAFMFWVD